VSTASRVVESGKNHSGSGSEQLQIRNEFEVKILLKTGKI
jgi:hypothetical protein